MISFLSLAIPLFFYLLGTGLAYGIVAVKVDKEIELDNGLLVVLTLSSWFFVTFMSGVYFVYLLQAIHDLITRIIRPKLSPRPLKTPPFLFQYHDEYKGEKTDVFLN